MICRPGRERVSPSTKPGYGIEPPNQHMQWSSRPTTQKQAQILWKLGAWIATVETPQMTLLILRTTTIQHPCEANNTKVWHQSEDDIILGAHSFVSSSVHPGVDQWISGKGGIQFCSYWSQSLSFAASSEKLIARPYYLYSNIPKNSGDNDYQASLCVLSLIFCHI